MDDLCGERTNGRAKTIHNFFKRGKDLVPETDPAQLSPDLFHAQFDEDYTSESPSTNLTKALKNRLIQNLKKPLRMKGFYKVLV